MKLAKDGKKRLGYNFLSDPWLRPMVGGALPNNEGYAFVFVGDWK
ncbi:hypothetical protein CCP3SC1AL1_1190019 [Gammaproteobacteria bacterium]